MRRSWTVPVAAVIGSLAAFGVTSIASAAPAASQPDITAVQSFTVLAHATNFKSINGAGKGIGPGDYWWSGGRCAAAARRAGG